MSYLNYISSYEDRGSMASDNAAIKDLFGTIDPFVTLDLSFLVSLPGGVNLVLSGMNLLDTRPPLVNIEQAYDGFTHDPKGPAGEAGGHISTSVRKREPVLGIGKRTASGSVRADRPTPGAHFGSSLPGNPERSRVSLSPDVASWESFAVSGAIHLVSPRCLRSPYTPGTTRSSALRDGRLSAGIFQDPWDATPLPRVLRVLRPEGSAAAIG